MLLCETVYWTYGGVYLKKGQQVCLTLSRYLPGISTMEIVADCDEDVTKDINYALLMCSNRGVAHNGRDASPVVAKYLTF